MFGLDVAVETLLTAFLITVTDRQKMDVAYELDEEMLAGITELPSVDDLEVAAAAAAAALEVLAQKDGDDEDDSDDSSEDSDEVHGSKMHGHMLECSLLSGNSVEHMLVCVCLWGRTTIKPPHLMPRTS